MFLECARRASVNHTKAYADDVNVRLEHIARWLGGRSDASPSRVTLAMVEDFKADERTRGITDRTINRYLNAWKKAMRLAVDDNLAPRRVLESFRKLREPQPEPHRRGLTMDELDSFLCAVSDERYYWLFRTVVGSGIRDDEVRHLVAGNVRDNALVITPLPPGGCSCHQRGWTTKNFRCRTVPIKPETAAAARQYAEAKPTMNLDKKAIWRQLKDARTAAGHAWTWSLHDLRRAWGSHLLAAGCKLSDISRWYGHGDVKTTMRYLRVVEDEMPCADDLPL